MLSRPYHYYDDNAAIYPTRLDAIKSGVPCKFYYRDEDYARIPWRIEPVESLPELYRRRAQQIRDTYDYVIVCYSGGVDSTNVLESFYYNDIHIDEILVVGALSQDSAQGVDDNHNGELYHNVFPTLRSMSLPNTKVSIVDYAAMFRDPGQFPLVRAYGPEFFRAMGAYTSVHNLWWYDAPRFLGLTRATALVFGAEKPNMRRCRDTGRFFTSFSDASITDYGGRYDALGRRVNFYSDPEGEAVMRKQLHLLHQIYLDRVVVNQTQSDWQYYNGFLDLLDEVVYPVRHPLAFKSAKSKTKFLSARDMFITTKRDSEMFKLYYDGFQKLKAEIDLEAPHHFFTRRYFFA